MGLYFEAEVACDDGPRDLYSRSCTTSSIKIPQDARTDQTQERVEHGVGSTASSRLKSFFFVNRWLAIRSHGRRESKLLIMHCSSTNVIRVVIALFNECDR